MSSSNGDSPPESDEHVVWTDKLSFSYNSQAVLKDVSLRVPVGSVYGFLGRNGAGKTTTIKILLGLLNGYRGLVSVFGRDVAQNRIGILKRTGALIESPSLYENLSGFDNVRMTALLRGIQERKIPDVLEMVGLSNHAHKRTGAYSHGMKQRLGIALALLPDPELLILDEPTNGLDPNGIQDMRELFKRLNKEYGKTLLISSHILSEVEKTCDHLGIIESGELVFQDSMSSFRKVGTEKVLVRVTDTEMAIQKLSDAGFATFLSEDPAMIEFDFVDDDDTSRRIKPLIEAGLDIYMVSTKNVDLETFFLDRIRGGAL